jgi:hypothetical protein
VACKQKSGPHQARNREPNVAEGDLQCSSEYSWSCGAAVETQQPRSLLAGGRQDTEPRDGVACMAQPSVAHACNASSSDSAAHSRSHGTTVSISSCSRRCDWYLTRAQKAKTTIAKRTIIMFSCMRMVSCSHVVSYPHTRIVSHDRHAARCRPRIAAQLAWGSRYKHVPAQQRPARHSSTCGGAAAPAWHVAQHSACLRGVDVARAAAGRLACMRSVRRWRRHAQFSISLACFTRASSSSAFQLSLQPRSGRSLSEAQEYVPLAVTRAMVTLSTMRHGTSAPCDCDR